VLVIGLRIMMIVLIVPAVVAGFVFARVTVLLFCF
jgi:hypothetical protein